MKPKLDLNKIAKSLGAVRRGKITSRGGYFGAMQLLAETTARFGKPRSPNPRPDPFENEQPFAIRPPKHLM